MKPIVIIAISVVCSVGAVLAVLVGLQMYAVNEAQKAVDEYEENIRMNEKYFDDVLIYYESIRDGSMKECVLDENKSYLQRQQCQIRASDSVKKYIYSEFEAREIKELDFNYSDWDYLETLDDLNRIYYANLRLAWDLICDVNNIQCYQP